MQADSISWFMISSRICSSLLPNSLIPVPPTYKTACQVWPRPNRIGSKILRRDLDAYFREIAKGIEEGKFEKTEELDARKRQLFDDLEEALNDQIIGVKEDRYGLRNSNFFFGLELETKDLIAVSARFAKLYNRMQLVMKKERDRLL